MAIAELGCRGELVRFHCKQPVLELKMLKTDKYVQLQNTCVYIWVNYNISLTWIKAIWGWFPFLTRIPVRSQWGRYNLPRYIYIYIIIYIYIHPYTVWFPACQVTWNSSLIYKYFLLPPNPEKTQKVKVRNCHESAKIGFFQGSRFYKNHQLITGPQVLSKLSDSSNISCWRPMPWWPPADNFG